MAEEIKIKRDHFIIGVVVILIIIFASVYYFYYMPKQNYQKSIITYKKAMYDSVICQYSCPLTEQKFQKTNQSLPDQQCIKTCTEAVKALNISGSQFSDSDLLKDNLFADLDLIIKNCQTSSTQTVDNVTIINSSSFFTCVKPEAVALKEKYSYLN